MQQTDMHYRKSSRWKTKSCSIRKLAWVVYSQMEAYMTKWGFLQWLIASGYLQQNGIDDSLNQTPLNVPRVMIS